MWDDGCDAVAALVAETRGDDTVPLVVVDPRRESLPVDRRLHVFLFAESAGGHDQHRVDDSSRQCDCELYVRRPVLPREEPEGEGLRPGARPAGNGIPLYRQPITDATHSLSFF